MSDTEKKEAPDPPSEEFLKAISAHMSSITGECDFCGRFYYTVNDGSYDYEYGEFDRYEAQAKENPDKYICVEGSVPKTMIDGKTYIRDCECNGVRRYEDWVWSHREIILDYFRRRTELEFKEAKMEFIAAHEVHLLHRNLLLPAPILKKVKKKGV